MPNKYDLKLTRNAIALERRWVPDPGGKFRAPIGGGGARAGMPGLSTRGRVSMAWSARSRRNMRFEFSALPWELLGARPAMITLTYPGDWQLYVPHSAEFVRHRENFKERWRKKYGPPIGVWVTEFQKRGAPHLHLYAGIPDDVSDDDYRLLQDRTTARRRREYDLGRFEARRRAPMVPGEFGEWLRTIWWEVVGSGLPAHLQRGVDVTVAFYSERASAETNREKVAEYFWRESGKWLQKRPPEGFGPLKFYGRWSGGKGGGFNPVVDRSVLDERAGLELRRMLLRLKLNRMRAEAARFGRNVPRSKARSRGRDGLKVFGVKGVDIGPRLVALAEDLALEKAGRPDRSPDIDYPTVRSRRAASELPAVTRRSWIPHDEWVAMTTDSEPEEWQLVSQAEAYHERLEREQQIIDDAVDDELARLDRIDLVRMMNGLPPKRRPKGLKLFGVDLSGRERKAR